MNEKAKKGLILGVIIVLIIALVFGGLFIFRNIGKTDEQISEEDAASRLSKLYSHIKVNEKDPIKSSVNLDENDAKDELPSIDKYPLSVSNTTDTYVEIFCSPEKSGTSLNCLKTTGKNSLEFSSISKISLFICKSEDFFISSSNRKLSSVIVFI